MAGDKPVDRRRGGPRAEEPSSPVWTRIPVSQHDRLIAMANRHSLSVHALVRRILIFQLDKPHP